MDIKLNIEKFNKLQGALSDSAMAGRLGIGRTQLWRLKTGESCPGQKFIAGFLKAFPDQRFEDYFFIDSVALQERNKANNTA